MIARTRLIGKVQALAQRVQTWLKVRPTLRRWMAILRLGLFQFGLGLSLAPITGTLNRVLIDEMGIPALSVGFLIAIHYFISPVRAVIGFHSDRQRALGRWRLPYLVFGAMLTYGGLAVAPFTLILLSGEGMLSFPLAMVFCSAIFLAYGLGVNIVETIYLATVSDLTPPNERGQVLAVLWGMLVLGSVVGSLIIGQLLLDYSHTQLIRVMQGSAVVFIALTFVAMLGQERLKPNGELEGYTGEASPIRQSLGASLRLLASQKLLTGLFGVLFLATLGFATHDILLEPYGGQVLGMSIAATTQLTAWWGGAMLLAIVGAGWMLLRQVRGLQLVLAGLTCGALGFLVISYAPDATMFRIGVAGIGLGRGLFIVGALASVMSLVDRDHAGLFLALWGISQAIAQGFGTIFSGLGRDLIQTATGNISLGYWGVYGAAALLIVIAAALLVGLRLERHMRAGDLQSPWGGLGQVNADQIIF